MFQHFFKLVFRTAERKLVQGGSRLGETRSDFERPTTEFLAQVLKKALAQKNAEGRGGCAVHQTPEEPSEDVKQPDEKVVRFIPRPRPEPKKISETRRSTDDDDPVPSAA
jgi:hypothetical protein